MCVTLREIKPAFFIELVYLPPPLIQKLNEYAQEYSTYLHTALSFLCYKIINLYIFYSQYMISSLKLT